LNGKRHPFALFAAAALERGRGAQGGVEGDVAGLAVGGARLDIAAAFAVGARGGAPSAFAARYAV